MSATALSCNTCNKPFRVLSNQAGRNVRCPHCGGVNAVSPSIFKIPSQQVSTAIPDRELSNDPVSDGQHEPTATANQNPFEGVSEAFRDAHRKTAMRDLLRKRMAFTHSTLAKVTNSFGKVVIVVALLVEIYVLVTAEWSDLANLPLKLALPAFALTLVPASSIAVTGVFLLVAAHCTEYLARMAATTELR
jgi:phage FluMu protein Com